MQLEKIEKKYSGNYVHLYEATYKNEEGNDKIYELLSRNKQLSKNEFGNKKEANAIGIIVFNKDKSKILVQKEFRLACNSWIYNFPGGLIDENETFVEAAKRELKEETGLDLIQIIDVLNESFTAVGISDECVKTIIGIADGEFSKSTSADEEIEAKWYSKDEIKKLLETEQMSLRTQSFLYKWVYEDVGKIRKDQVKEYFKSMEDWIKLNNEKDEWEDGYKDALKQVFVDLCKICNGSDVETLFQDRF